MTLIENTILGAAVGLGTASVLAPVIYKLLLKTNSRQTVSEHIPEHKSKQGTPTMGGLIMVVSVIVAFITFWNAESAFPLFLFVWFALIGFLDDFLIPRMQKGKRGLGWIPKLAMQFFPFFVLFTKASTAPLWIFALTAFVVLFFANAYNFSDGMDCLAGSLGLIISLTIAGVALICCVDNLSQSQIPILIALAMSFVPFLMLNAPPAKVFMGDVGSMPIGALLGYYFLQSTVFSNPSAPNPHLMLIASPLLLIMLLELVPVPLQIASAKLRKGKRLFPFKTPIHHGFQAAGWPEPRIVALFVLCQFVASVAAIALISWDRMVPHR